MDQGKKDPKILETVGKKRSQLTNYKKIIRGGRLEELKFGRTFKQILSEEKDTSVSNVKKQTSEDGQKLNSKMIAEIEKEPEGDLRFEYFVDGNRKFCIPESLPLMFSPIMIRMKLKC